MISVESYHIFLSVADCLSFSEAAKQLGLTLNKVSRSVADLEAELGSSLFTRTTRTVTLTPKGAAFARDVRPALAALKAAEGALDDGIKSRKINVLRIACGSAEGQALIAPAMPGFLAQHPEAQVALDLMSRPVAVDNEGYDLALRLHNAAPQLKPVVRLDLALCASPAYCATHNRPYAASDVAQHKLLVWSGMRQWAFRGSLAFDPRPHFLSNDIKIIKECCVAANGIALLPLALVRDELASQGLIQLLDGFEPRPLELVADWGDKPAPLHAAQAFIDYLKDYFRQQRL